MKTTFIYTALCLIAAPFIGHYCPSKYSDTIAVAILLSIALIGGIEIAAKLPMRRR